MARHLGVGPGSEAQVWQAKDELGGAKKCRQGSASNDPAGNGTHRFCQETNNNEKV